MEEDVNELVARMRKELECSAYPDERSSIHNRYIDTSYYLYKCSQIPHRKSFLTFGSRRSSIVSNYGNTPTVIRRSFSTEGKLDCTVEQIPPSKLRGARNLPSTGNEDSDIEEEEEVEGDSPKSQIEQKIGVSHKPDISNKNGKNVEGVLNNPQTSFNVNSCLELQNKSSNVTIPSLVDDTKQFHTTDKNRVSPHSPSALSNKPVLPCIANSSDEKGGYSQSQHTVLESQTDDTSFPDNAKSAFKSPTHKKTTPIQSPKRIIKSHEENSSRSSLSRSIPSDSDSVKSGGISFPPLISPDCNVKEDHVIRVAVTSLPMVSSRSPKRSIYENTTLHIEESSESIINGECVHKSVSSNKESRSFIMIQPNESKSVDLRNSSKNTPNESLKYRQSPTSRNQHLNAIPDQRVSSSNETFLSSSTDGSGVTLLKFTRSSEDRQRNYRVSKPQIKSVPYEYSNGSHPSSESEELVDTNLSRLCVVM